jgi:tetratricopeptide (TPR) repeat protein
MLTAHCRTMAHLADAMADFVRHGRHRVLHLAITPELRQPCLELVVWHELHPDNDRGFVVLDTPYYDGAPGWRERAVALRTHHERRRAAMHAAGDDLGDLGEPHACNDDPVAALAAFGAQLADLARSVRAPLGGFVVVIAPSRLETPARLARDLDVLLASAHLAELRFIVVEPGVELARWAGRRADGTSHDARLDEAAALEAMRRMMRAAADAGPGSPSHAIVGAAWPRVAPPPRREQAAMDETARRELAGVADGRGALDFDSAVRLRNLLYGAALDVEDEEAREAVLDRQRQAVALCVGAGWTQQAAICEAILAGYHFRYRDADGAVALYRDAAERAEAAAAWDVAVAADLARGSILRSLGRREQALDAFTVAVRRGRRGATLAVLLEAWRQVAELAVELGLDAVARDALGEAVASARAAAIEEAHGSCAGELARALADMHRRGGDQAEAEACMDLAEALEGPPFAGAEAAS